MKATRLIFLFVVGLNFCAKSQSDSLTIYLIPGQGADYRLFDSLEIEGDYKFVHIEYHTPDRKVDMHGFAQELALQINTTEKFILIGASLGGMIASEMSTFLNPEKVIIISSAKCRAELPFRYRFQKQVPLFEIFPPGVIKLGARVLQPIVEADSRTNPLTFKSMLKEKDPKFLKRTIRMIVNWELKTCDSNTIHIHGSKDKTIPIRNVNSDFEVENGSHMITLTRAKELNEVLEEILGS